MVRNIVMYLSLLLGSISLVKAQPDRLDSIRLYLDSRKSPDSRQLIRAFTLLAEFKYTPETLVEIDALTNAYMRTKNLDTAYFLKCRIQSGLGKIDNENAIKYGRNLYSAVSQYKGANTTYFRYMILKTLRVPYRNSAQVGEAFKFYNEELKYFISVKDSINVSTCYYIISGLYMYSGLSDQAIYTIKKSLSWTGKYNYTHNIFGVSVGNRYGDYINNVGVLGEIYLTIRQLDYSRYYSRIALELLKTEPNLSNSAYNKKNIIYSFVLSGHLDSAEQNINNFSPEEKESTLDMVVSYNQVMALYLIKKGDHVRADSIVRLCHDFIDKYKIPASAPNGVTEPSYYEALIRIEQKKYRDAIRLLETNLWRVRNIRSSLIRDHQMLAELYTLISEHENANKAYANYIALQKTLQADQAKYATLSFETEQQIAANELSLISSKNAAELATTTRNFSIGIAVLLVLLGIGLLARYRSQKKTNHALGMAMSELKASQTQLVQAEKMASLGELTAGIAHEIQNPLNFVNNFAESSKELLDEMKTALGSGDHAEATAIADDVILNLEKIHSHGNRADSIVKGMLQHSRSNSGVKELTNINSLADEYLRLAYHGLRAKNPSFNALTKTEFDQSIGNINVIPQDMGRVLLNMINNAFYAVDEKKKQIGDGYEPEVTVSTRLVGLNNLGIRSSANSPIPSVIISVKDNGNGIPPEVQKKIFQPFFTTKPTGQGTGLGLSLSYDIIKAHGGEIKVNTMPGEGTEFRIMLPI